MVVHKCGYAASFVVCHNKESCVDLVATEMFAQFVYSPELTYDDLHSREDELRAFTEALLIKRGAEFINFEPMGDTLHAQCVFKGYGEDIGHGLCEDLAPLMDTMMEGRLLFVQKDLQLLSLYTLSQKTWQEATLTLPMAGPIGRSLYASHAKKPKK